MSKKKPKINYPNNLVLFRHAACRNRVAAEAMLKEWPNLLEARSATGETALHWHAIEGANETVQWLLSRNAKVDTRSDNGTTPLMHAAQLGLLDTCKILLLAGADPTLVDHNSDSVLHYAARYGHLEICRLLIESGAKADPMNQDGQRPSDVALPRKRELICQMLTSPAPLRSYSNPRSNKSSSSKPR